MATGEIHATAEQRAAATRDLAAYRRSAGYLDELWRPQFHFSPERNWMNDPNGLVFHEGEYHLFYQHNPVGNVWGHMSWGHAVSNDLVHWEHLPVAIWESDGESIYSGSCVADPNNTAGFASNGESPLVAVYTSQRPWLQTQALAHSNDNGRTWTKYAGNPVLDVGNSDFRDPKVFWHEPTEAWVMVVALAREFRLQIYRSADLKKWDLASEFGPAGIAKKASWECAELLKLPVEDSDGRATGQTRWLLKADVDTNAYAGGSGGEYFVGSFDGFRFECEHDLSESQPVDFGRDFFAALGWSGIRTEEGRPIWAGWLNNWEAPLLPTAPWRGDLSAPRTLALRRIGKGLRLVQRPVRELEVLRAERIDGRTSEVRGRQLDLVLEVREIQDQPVELRVFKGEDEETVIGFDPATASLYVDRRRSGQTDFHPTFLSSSRAPLPLMNGELDLRVLVDHSTIEVFAADGSVALTSRIFPSAESDRVELVAPRATVTRFDAWRMQSIWDVAL